MPPLGWQVAKSEFCRDGDDNPHTLCRWHIKICYWIKRIGICASQLCGPTLKLPTLWRPKLTEPSKTQKTVHRTRKSNLNNFNGWPVMDGSLWHYVSIFIFVMAPALGLFHTAPAIVSQINCSVATLVNADRADATRLKHWSRVYWRGFGHDCRASA